MRKRIAKKRAAIKKLSSEKFTANHVIKTSYLGAVYSKRFLKNIPKAVKKIREFRKKHPFDAIAFSGSSGAGYAYPLSYLLKIPLIHVRKSGSSSNYRSPIEGTISSKKYLIVDDFISSGDTMRYIISKIENNLDNEAKPVGIFLYSGTNNGKIWNGIPIIKI